jgi:hypothetical protein
MKIKSTLPPGQITNQGYFSYLKAIHSNTAHANEIDNYPGSDYDPNNPIEELHKDNIMMNLHRLFKYCVNPIVRNYGKQNVALTSVYRNKEVNRIIKGVENSQHIYGYAADIVLTNLIPTSLNDYHQLIWEYPERKDWTAGNSLYSWIHISYIKGRNQKINSVSSIDPKIHKAYEDENTFYLDNFTHRIKFANQELLEE